MSTSEDQQPLEKLKALRNKVNWNIEEERCNFLVQHYLLFKDHYSVRIRSGSFPEIHEFLLSKEIECLLWDSVNYKHEEFGYDPGNVFIELTVDADYTDEPDVDENGTTLTRRTTPIHQAVKNSEKSRAWIRLLPNLFEIYDRFDVNFTDESGYTHFHAACRFSCKKAVREFLEHGQDPNCIWPETGDSALHIAVGNAEWVSGIMEMLLRGGADPNLVNKKGLTPLHIIAELGFHFEIVKLFDINEELNQLVQINARDKLGNTPLHLALEYGYEKKVLEVLLRKGADPTLANNEGSTPLHLICRDFFDHFAASDELNQRVQVDARDNFDRIPLQWAVASCLPHTVESLLNRGAELSSFIFPTLSQFDVRFKSDSYKYIRYKLGLASGLLAVIENLEKGGYELDRSEVLIIMKLFYKYKLFEAMEDLDKSWYDDEEFANDARKTMIKPDLSLDDLFHLRPQEAAKRLTCMDYYEFANQENLWWIRYPSSSVHQAFCRHLCERMSRKFFRSWALEPFWKLIHYRLPLECCELILENLQNRDLCHISLAAEGQTDKAGKINVITNVIKCNNERPVRARKAPKRLQIEW